MHVSPKSESSSHSADDFPRRSPPHSAEGSATEPFDELHLSPDELAVAVHRIETSGYTTVAMLPETRRFIDERLAGHRPMSWPGDEVVSDLRGEEVAKKATLSARRVLDALGLPPAPLEPQEFELRSGVAAEAWHTDKAPKYLTITAPARGRGTEFVSSAHADDFFDRDNNYDIIRPKDSERLAPHIEYNTKDEFLIFAARGVDSDKVPKLIHRTPPNREPDRTVFLARWRKPRRPNPVAFNPSCPPTQPPSRVSTKAT